MPGMTGSKLLAALRQVAPALPVAVTSAHALDGTLASLLGHVDEYLEAAAGGQADRDRDRPDRAGTQAGRGCGPLGADRAR